MKVERTRNEITKVDEKGKRKSGNDETRKEYVITSFTSDLELRT